MQRVTVTRIVVISAMSFVFPIAWFMGETMNVNAGGNQNAATPPPAVASQAEQTFDQAAALAELRKSIAGKEQAPAETVFKNIQMLKGMPAARLLRVMEMGYARSLGVNCTHCHIPGAWEKDDKPTKQIARDMSAMVGAINTQHLKQIKNLKSEQPVVNCTTCHRGQIKRRLISLSRQSRRLLKEDPRKFHAHFSGCLVNFEGHSFLTHEIRCVSARHQRGWPYGKDGPPAQFV